MKPTGILQELRKETDEIILFHSLSGKDSIVLLNMTTQIFTKVHCVFMYVVQDLEHMAKYKRFFQANYKNAVWHETPHYAYYNYRKLGHLGCEKDPKQTQKSLSKIMQEYRKKIGLEWVVLGSKQSDGLSRRLQLRTYVHEAIDYKNFKCYPLSKWGNKDCLTYIKHNQLITPQNYGDNKQSASNDVTDGLFLTWCKNNYPGDYTKIINQYPESEIIQYRYETKRK